MIEKAVLQKHYAEYATRSDDRVRDRKNAKRSIIRHVLTAVPVTVHTSPLKVVVLGASDKRYLPIHAKIFAEVLGAVEVSTLDVDAEHLGKGSDVIEHDVTTPFPNRPYAVVFSHELMKFLTEDEQLKVIMNSYDALQTGGVAMHVMHEPSIKGTVDLQPWQYRVNPDALMAQLSAAGISAQKLVFESESSVERFRGTIVIVLKKE